MHVLSFVHCHECLPRLTVLNLFNNTEYKDVMFDEIQKEWLLCLKLLKKITENEELLDSNKSLKKNVRNRDPYINPLNYLQVELLKRYRSGNKDVQIKEAILLAINGISAGLRNSG